MGACPVKRLIKTSAGAAKSAICVLLPRLIPTLRSMRPAIALRTADKASAAFPASATTITPTNRSLKPELLRCSFNRSGQDLTHPADECRAEQQTRHGLVFR